MKSRDHLDLASHHILDGGMASELEFLGADISGPLWSAHVLEAEPEKILAVHRAYLEGGADILLTASYQVSRKGYAEFGLDPARADDALLRSVEIARQTCKEFPDRRILIAASLGPYGAALHNGAEYHGNYDCSHAELVEFHRSRIAVLAESDPETGPDLLAFETLPSLPEVRAIGEALEPWPNLAAWFCFNSPDHRAPGLQIAHGELLRDCAAVVASFPQTVAIGLNCTQPRWLPILIPELKVASNKPIVLYPNSGEGWDAENRCWTELPDGPGNSSESFAQQSKQWFAAGAQIIGGCCRTRPAHIRAITEALR